jgi:hypothetical protein
MKPRNDEALAGGAAQGFMGYKTGNTEIIGDHGAAGKKRHPGAYVYLCVGCNKLDQSGRRDVITCSPACRVRAHRNGSSKALHDQARRMDVGPALILQARAIVELCPDLANQVRAGSLTIEDAQPEVNAAFIKLLFAAADARNGSAETLPDEIGRRTAR